LKFPKRGEPEGQNESGPLDLEGICVNGSRDPEGGGGVTLKHLKDGHLKKQESSICEGTLVTKS
jgi:hypothetical protein